MTRAQQAFVILSLHAKMHQQLNAINRRNVDVERDEIKAYDDNTDYELETVKKELLAIRFLE